MPCRFPSRVRVVGARQSGQRLHSVDQQRYSFICGGRDDDGTGALKQYRKKSFTGTGMSSPAAAPRCEKRRGCEKREDMRNMRSLAIRPFQDAAQIAAFSVSTAMLPWPRS